MRNLLILLLIFLTVATYSKEVKFSKNEFKRNEKSFGISFALKGGYYQIDEKRNYYTKEVLGYDIERTVVGKFSSQGLGFELEYRFNDSFSVYWGPSIFILQGTIEKESKEGANKIKKEESVGYVPMKTAFGFKLSSGDVIGTGLVYYGRLGASFGNTASKLGSDTEDNQSYFSFDLELGMNVFILKNNNLDIFITASMGSGSEGNYGKDDDMDVLSGVIDAFVGVRYNFFIF